MTPRGFAGPNLLAMILFEKFGQHQPLNRQSERYAREGVDLSLSTLADQVGACAAASAAAVRVDRTPRSGLPSGCTAMTPRFRSWRKARPKLAGSGLMSATIGRSAARTRRRRCSTPRAIAAASIRSGIWRRLAGILQADAVDGYNRSICPDRNRVRSRSAMLEPCATKFFELADIAANARRGKQATPISPIALEAVRRIDGLFEIEREINGLDGRGAVAARPARSAPLVAALEAWMRAERAKLSRHNAVAKAIDYMLKRWQAFTRFLDDGRICLYQQCGRARPDAVWLWAGSRGCSPAQTRVLHTAHLVIPLNLKEIFLVIVRQRPSRPPSVRFALNGLARQLGMRDNPGRALARLARGKCFSGDQSTHG